MFKFLKGSLGATLKALTISALLGFTAAYAGSTTGNTDFQAIYDLIVGWTTGVLGKTIAIAFILIGVIGGVARGSLMAFAIGVGSGVGLLYIPGVIDTLFTAVLV